MNRFFIAGVLALAASSPAFAQDMPLSQILIDGEGWKKVAKPGAKPKLADWVAQRKGSDQQDALTAISMSSVGAYVFRFASAKDPEDERTFVAPFPKELKRCGGMVLSADGPALLAGDADGKYIWAIPMLSKRTLGNGSPYCSLRLARGETTSQVNGLTVDEEGRIYAATEIGVQVFDPTGRLCGVLTPAAPGKPEHLAFEGDLLTHWIGDTKYARKLNTQGAK